QSYHKLEIKYQILQHQYNKLEEAFINEKKCHQRGKPFLLEKPEDWHGGAVFYSPTKKKQALKEERVHERLPAWELKVQAREAKAFERAEKQLQKQLEKQLKIDIQLSKRGNRQSLNPRTPQK
ncbi:uncharacterized protein EI97DRAFT_378047, partial [Westerdykella ornata]